MFGLSLPEHVQINLDPNPEDGGKTFLLVIVAKDGPDSEPFHLRKTIARDVGAIQFGKDMMFAMNHLYQATRKDKKP